MKLGRRPSFKRTTSMLQYPSPETIVIFYYEWSWAEGTASKGQVQCSNIQVQQQSWFQSFVIRNEVGPQAQLHKDKSNGPTSKSRNDNDLLLKMKLGLNKSNAPTSESRSKHDLLLKMKLGRRPSFKRTSAMLQHTKSSINHNWSVLRMKLGRRPSFKRPSPMAHHPSPETIMICH